jgi:hypothetical protein
LEWECDEIDEVEWIRGMVEIWRGVFTGERDG